MLTLKQRLIDIAIVVVIIALSLFALYKLDHHFFNLLGNDIQAAPVGVPVVATPSPVAAKQPKIVKPIKAKTVAVYPAAVKAKLTLPQAYKDDIHLDVVASTRVPADNHPATVNTLFNTETGETVTAVNREPLPWIGSNHSGQIGLFALQKSGGQVIQLEAQQSLVQIKAFNIGAKVAIEQPISGPGDTDYRVGFGGWVNW